MGARSNITVCVIYSEGNKIPDHYHLTYASVRKEINRIGKATLQLYAGNTGHEPFEVSDHSAFKHGSAIRLEVVRDKKKTVLFEGFVTSTGLQVDYDQPDLLTVECRDYAFLTTLGRKNNVYEKSKDCDIVKKIISGYDSLSVKAEDTGVEHTSLVQYYCTDWDFILSRADVCGMVVLTSGKEIRFEQPALSANPVAEFTHGTDLLDFKGSLSLADQYAEVNAVAWNHNQQEVVTEKAGKPVLNEQGDLAVKDLTERNKNTHLLQTDSSVDKALLKAWVNAAALKNALSRYSGYFTVAGNDIVVPGSIVSLKGMGKRFDGNLYVGYVEHTIEEHSWQSKVGMGLSRYSITEQPDVMAPLAAGLLPGIQGLHVGVVKQLHEDPGKEYRILVDLPLFSSEKRAVWARLTTVYAGNNTGIFFAPEIGEEVVVGFFNNDPCSPVILGCMFNAKRVPPAPLSAKNEKKVIITNQKLTFSFDDEKKIITLTTPGGSIVELNDDKKSVAISDQNKNTLTMDSNGIVMESAKDLILKAKGNIQMEATSKVAVAAKSSDITLEGLNVKATAKVGITCKGNATAEFSSSGNTVVKGAIVMIN